MNDILPGDITAVEVFAEVLPYNEGVFRVSVEVYRRSAKVLGASECATDQLVRARGFDSVFDVLVEQAKRQILRLVREQRATAEVVK